MRAHGGRDRVPAGEAEAAGLPPELSVGQVARRSGIAVSALHFYEARGLIASRRSSGNQRRYPRHVLRRLGVIKAAQQVGLSLTAIERAFASLPERRTPTDADWAALAAAWRAELADRIARLELLCDRLTGCIGCGCLSVKRCPLLNPQDALRARGPGAHFLEPEAPGGGGDDSAPERAPAPGRSRSRPA